MNRSDSMYSIRKVNRKDYGRRLINRYRYVYFGSLSGSKAVNNMVIASNRDLQIFGNCLVNVVEEHKLPLYKVDLNMRMGKGYKPIETRSYRSNFYLTEGNEGILYDVYEVL